MTARTGRSIAKTRKLLTTPNGNSGTPLMEVVVVDVEEEEVEGEDEEEEEEDEADEDEEEEEAVDVTQEVTVLVV